MFLKLMLVVLLVWMLWCRWQRRALTKLANQLKSSYRSLPFIGHSYLLIGGEEQRMKGIQLFGRDAIKQGGTVACWHAYNLWLIVADPVVAELILKHCLEKGDQVKYFHLLTGNGSVFAPGDYSSLISLVPIWRPRRKVLAPTFSPKNLAHFMDIFVHQSSVLIDNMTRKVGKGTFSLWNILTAFTIDSVCETTLGVKLGTQKSGDHPFFKATDELTNLAATRVCQPWLNSDLIFTRTSYWSKAMKNRSIVYDFIQKIIRKQRKALNERRKIENSDASENCIRTFLEMLMHSSGCDEGYTDMELQEEILVIVMAGTDTSAVAIAFTLVMLSRHPDVQDKVYQELQEVFGDSDRKVDIHDLSKLVYLEAVIKETLRVYPPVPVIVRKVQKDIQLPSGVTLLEGCTILIHIWAIHRNSQYWGDDAEEYRPERFIESPLKHPAAFIPFSHGPRGCLGTQYAMMNLKTTLSSLLRCYRVLPSTDAKNPNAVPLRVKYDIMMRDVAGYLIQLESRT